MINPPFYYQPVDGAVSTLALAHSVGGLTLVVQPGDAALFGSPTPSNPLRVTVQRADSSGVRSHYHVSGRVGNVLSISGPIDGYQDLAFSVNDRVGVLVTAATITDLQTSVITTVNALNTIQLTPGPVGPSGVVTATSPLTYSASTQTIGFTTPGTNKAVLFNNNGTVAADSSLSWDRTNHYLGINTSNPQYPCHINAVANKPAFVMAGVDSGFLNNNDPNNGPAFLLTWNQAGNRQLTLLDSAQIGQGSKYGFRYILGFDLPIIDCVGNDGNAGNYGNLSLGQATTCVGFGFNAGEPQSAIGAQAHILNGSGNRPGLVVQSASGQWQHLQEWRDGSGNVLSSVGSRGDFEGTVTLSRRDDSQANTNEIYLSTTQNKPCWKDDNGTVHPLIGS